MCAIRCTWDQSSLLWLCSRCARYLDLCWCLWFSFVAVYLPVIRSEENFLREHFPGYADYTRQVPSLLPRTLWFRGVTRGSRVSYTCGIASTMPCLAPPHMLAGPDGESPLVCKITVNAISKRIRMLLAPVLLGVLAVHPISHSVRRCKNPPAHFACCGASRATRRSEMPHASNRYGRVSSFPTAIPFITKASGVSSTRASRRCALNNLAPQNHVSATADSTGVVALLYRVQDRLNTYFDGKTLCSYKLIKHTEEGSAPATR